MLTIPPNAAAEAVRELGGEKKMREKISETFKYLNAPVLSNIHIKLGCVVEMFCCW